MLQLTQKHLDALAEFTSLPLRRRVEKALRNHFPYLVDRYSDAQFERFCLAAWELAEAHRLEDQRDVCILALAQLVYGPDFKGAPWLPASLADRREDPRSRISYITWRMIYEQECRTDAWR